MPSAERIWQLWADPRQLERWWGRPPTPPPSRSMSEARRPRGAHMTGPDGDHARTGTSRRWIPRFSSSATVSPTRMARRTPTCRRTVPRHDRGDPGRPHPDVDHQHLPQYRGDGAAHGLRHGGGTDAGGGPDRRDPRRGRSRPNRRAADLTESGVAARARLFDHPPKTS